VLQAPPGAYPFRCRVPGHAGMEGLVIVESGPTGAGWERG
jgi:uncharacterized cupredoxin-like copper-binding protein